MFFLSFLFVCFVKLFINPASFIFVVYFIGRADLSLHQGRVFSFYVRPSSRAARVSSGSRIGKVIKVNTF